MPNRPSPHEEYRDRLASFLESANDKLEGADDSGRISLDDDERLVHMFLLHLDEYTQRLDEIGGFGVGGIEPDFDRPLQGIHSIDTPEKRRKLDLVTSVEDYWVGASMAYLYANFRGCIFQSATMMESGLRLLVLHAGVQEEFDDYIGDGYAPLGTLIQFHNRENTIPKEVLEDAFRLKELRKEHIHQLIERGESKKEYSKTRDEFVAFEDFDGTPPVRINPDGSISGDGANVVFGKDGAGLMYKHKKDARRALTYSRTVLRKLF